MNCTNCGEQMEGDGIRVAFYCPNYTGINVEFTTPDDNPIYCEEDMKDPNYAELDSVLRAAYNQAAHGKGRDRHANDEPFHEQRMQKICELISSPKGMEYQAIKKLTEAAGLGHDARERELLGAIVYIAGMVIYHRKHSGGNPLLGKEFSVKRAPNFIPSVTESVKDAPISREEFQDSYEIRPGANVLVDSNCGRLPGVVVHPAPQTPPLPYVGVWVKLMEGGIQPFPSDKVTLV